MSVFGDIKDSIGGSDSNSSNNRDFGGNTDNNSNFGSSDFDSSFENDNNRQPSKRAHNLESGHNQNTGDHGAEANLHNQGGKPPENRRQQQQRSGSRRDSPNPQAGRPQEGGTSPQLSSQTEKKMQNAGIKDSRSSQRNNRKRNEGKHQSGNTVANDRSDIEELKSQNQQIIELLKRINDNLQTGSRTHQRR